MPDSVDRTVELEARIAQLENRAARPTPFSRPRLIRRLAVVSLVIALIIPAGVVLASHRFNDVPTGHQFHADIAAIADAGITSGCPQGTDNYCPNGLVTRGQMAAFLNRLGALGPGKVPKVNADKVDGLDSRQLLLGTATIPSGVTVTGFIVWDHAVVANDQDVQVSVQLPAPAPVALQAGTVNFAPHALAADDDATCTGTAAAPTAPAGKVCIYLSASSAFDGGQGFDASVPGFETRGFLISMVTNSGAFGSDMYFWASWAYTAP
jgi:hypothetical protein